MGVSKGGLASGEGGPKCVIPTIVLTEIEVQTPFTY